MKTPSFEQVSLVVLLVGGLFGLYSCSSKEQERYIDHCGDSVYKRPVYGLTVVTRNAPHYEPTGVALLNPFT